MTKIKPDSDIINYKSSYRETKDKTYNCKIALWQIPYDKRFSKYDTDKSKWFESINKEADNEIESVEQDLQINLNKYKTYVKTIQYTDNTFEEKSTYPNGTIVTVKKGDNQVFVNIKDKFERVVAEKFFNNSSNEGRKVLYKHYTKGADTFTVVRVFSYDTTKNKSTDIVNYGYTSLDSKLTDGCTFEKEYYMLNNKEVKPTKINEYEFGVKNEKGKKLTFLVE